MRIRSVGNITDNRLLFPGNTCFQTRKNRQGKRGRKVFLIETIQSFEVNGKTGLPGTEMTGAAPPYRSRCAYRELFSNLQASIRSIVFENESKRSNACSPDAIYCNVSLDGTGPVHRGTVAGLLQQLRRSPARQLVPELRSGIAVPECERLEGKTVARFCIGRMYMREQVCLDQLPLFQQLAVSVFGIDGPWSVRRSAALHCRYQKRSTTRQT